MRRLLTTMGLVAVLLTGLAVNAAPASAAPPNNACPYYHLCFWRDTHYQGPTRDFYYCGFEDLWGLPWLRTVWGDVDNDTSSLVNNQTSGTTSVFWDVEGGRASLSQHSYGYRDNLVIDGWNDRISYILVC